MEVKGLALSQPKPEIQINLKNDNIDSADVLPDKAVIVGGIDKKNHENDYEAIDTGRADIVDDKLSDDSGKNTPHSFQSELLAYTEIPSAETAIIKPNLNSIRKILGGDGTDQQRKVVEENTGLIPKYYKPYKLLESTECGRPVSLYKCGFCNQDYRGHNSIVYHCRRHIGDYPYRCEDCGFVEVCKSGLSSHMNRTGHINCRKIDAQPLVGHNGGTVSTHNSTQIRRPKKDQLTISNEQIKRKRFSGRNVEEDVSPKKKANLNDTFNRTPVKRNPHFSNNNDPLISTMSAFRNLYEAQKLPHNKDSWYLLGGSGTKTTETKSPSARNHKKASKPVRMQKATNNGSDSSDPDETVDSMPTKVLDTNNKLPKATPEATKWKFCGKCQSAWYNLEEIYTQHVPKCK